MKKKKINTFNKYANNRTLQLSSNFDAIIGAANSRQIRLVRFVGFLKNEKFRDLGKKIFNKFIERLDIEFPVMYEKCFPVKKNEFGFSDSDINTDKILNPFFLTLSYLRAIEDFGWIFRMECLLLEELLETIAGYEGKDKDNLDESQKEILVDFIPKYFNEKKIKFMINSFFKINKVFYYLNERTHRLATGRPKSNSESLYKEFINYEETNETIKGFKNLLNQIYTEAANNNSGLWLKIINDIKSNLKNMVYEKKLNEFEEEFRIKNEDYKKKHGYKNPKKKEINFESNFQMISKYFMPRFTEWKKKNPKKTWAGLRLTDYDSMSLEKI